jgi:hypothetical protein
MGTVLIVGGVALVVGLSQPASERASHPEPGMADSVMAGSKEGT